MRIPSFPMIVFWIIVIVAPLAVSAAVVGQVPNAGEIPLHWNAAGEIDRWGTPEEAAGTFWFLGGIMAAMNLLMALGYVFNDFLYNRGLVHGVSRTGALKVYVVCAVILAVLTAAISFAILAKTLGAL